MGRSGRQAKAACRCRGDGQGPTESNGKYYEQIVEEMKELEEKKSEEALLLVHKKHDSRRYQNERDETRRLQRSGSSRRMKKEADSQDLLSLESCRSSAVDYTEEVSLRERCRTYKR